MMGLTLDCAKWQALVSTDTVNSIYYEKSAVPTFSIAMFLHIPNSIILMQDTISHNLMLVETPVRQLTTTELKCLA
jgi:hypothetical protein